jgi:hypothetical protein
LIEMFAADAAGYPGELFVAGGRLGGQPAQIRDGLIEEPQATDCEPTVIAARLEWIRAALYDDTDCRSDAINQPFNLSIGDANPGQTRINKQQQRIVSAHVAGLRVIERAKTKPCRRLLLLELLIQHARQRSQRPGFELHQIICHQDGKLQLLCRAGLLFLRSTHEVMTDPGQVL